MGLPAAKAGDAVIAIDQHFTIMPNGAIARLPYPFSGKLSERLSADVFIGGAAAATVDSVANNQPQHVPAPGTGLQRPPSNKGPVTNGSTTVFINGRGAARAGDPVATCNDPADRPPQGKIVVPGGTVFIG